MCFGHWIILFWGSRALYTWGQLVVGVPSALGMSAFVNRSYCCGVVELCTLGVDGGPCGLVNR